MIYDFVKKKRLKSIYRSLSIKNNGFYKKKTNFHSISYEYMDSESISFESISIDDAIWIKSVDFSQDFNWFE